MLKEIDVSIPPQIAGLNYKPLNDTADELEKAIREIVRIDASPGS